jgi:polar amino acid transport system substrate-binding protein
MKKIILALVMVSLLPMVLFAGGAAEEGAVMIATDATWPPMEYIDETGELVGFDVELINAIADEAGLEIELKNTAWDGIFAGLANGAYDAIISSVTITEERKSAMLFTEPYVNAGQVLIVKKSASGISGIEDMAGLKVGAQNGTTGDFAIEEYPEIERMAYDEIGLAVEDLMNGNISGVVCDSITASDFVLNNESYAGSLTIAGEPFTEEYLGIAVSKSRPDLVEKFNEGLAAVEASGKMDELVVKWLGD